MGEQQRTENRLDGCSRSCQLVLLEFVYMYINPLREGKRHTFDDNKTEHIG